MIPVISNQKLWRILSELEKPLKPQLSDGNPTSSTDILGTAQNVQNKQPKSKGSSSSFAEAFPNPPQTFVYATTSSKKHGAS